MTLFYPTGCDRHEICLRPTANRMHCHASLSSRVQDRVFATAPSARWLAVNPVLGVRRHQSLAGAMQLQCSNPSREKSEAKGSYDHLSGCLHRLRYDGIRDPISSHVPWAFAFSHHRPHRHTKKYRRLYQQQGIAVTLATNTKPKKMPSTTLTASSRARREAREAARRQAQLDAISNVAVAGSDVEYVLISHESDLR